ncbi:hypothetical protein DFH06DRAFT_1170642 [Mycena polygramma]|nr:hypothetical protein DFH06DRAFT_1170642 [Mycena polygramma]
MNLLNVGQLAVVALSALFATAAPALRKPSAGEPRFIGQDCTKNSSLCGIAIGPTAANGSTVVWSLKGTCFRTTIQGPVCLEVDICDVSFRASLQGNACHIPFSLGEPPQAAQFNPSLLDVGNFTIEGCGEKTMRLNMDNEYLTSCKKTDSEVVSTPCDEGYGLKMEYYCPMP